MVESFAKPLSISACHSLENKPLVQAPFFRCSSIMESWLNLFGIGRFSEDTWTGDWTDSFCVSVAQEMINRRKKKNRGFFITCFLGFTPWRKIGSISGQFNKLCQNKFKTSKTTSTSTSTSKRRLVID